tara:strand:- start:1010 stop:1213 length:204 start_codon:yes stop_codon:yes gene_type:complete
MSKMRPTKWFKDCSCGGVIRLWEFMDGGNKVLIICDHKDDPNFKCEISSKWITKPELIQMKPWRTQK